MSQELQEEAQSKKDQVDQSVQKSCWQRADSGMLFVLDSLRGMVPKNSTRSLPALFST